MCGNSPGKKHPAQSHERAIEPFSGESIFYHGVAVIKTKDGVATKRAWDGRGDGARQ